MDRSISIHVGVGAVDPAVYPSPPTRYLACEADAREMHALAVANGFAAEPPLLTKDATFAKLQKQLQRARTALADGGRLLITFAGHGTMDPSPTASDPNHVDEAWCLYDGLLLDNDINLFLCTLAANVRVLVVSDSCFSGSMLEALDRGHPRFLTPSAAAATPRHPAVPPAPPAAAAPTHSKEPRCNALLLAACRENEAAVETDRHGVFTEALLAVWNRGQFRGTHVDFITRIAALTPNQTPQLFVRGPLDGAFLRSRPFRTIDEDVTEGVATLRGVPVDRPADPPADRAVARVRIPIEITVSIGPITIERDPR